MNERVSSSSYHKKIRGAPDIRIRIRQIRHFFRSGSGFWKSLIRIRIRHFQNFWSGSGSGIFKIKFAGSGFLILVWIFANFLPQTPFLTVWRIGTIVKIAYKQTRKCFYLPSVIIIGVREKLLHIFLNFLSNLGTARVNSYRATPVWHSRRKGFFCNSL